ncbi:MAG: hypothetical protein MUO54_03920 [Anaerolineales bacterium]|nr:hypothetical protein [Anaerolineales bacterium]
MKTNKRTLILLAALVWYIGGVMLLRSGIELTRYAIDLRPGEYWPWLAVLTGVSLGIFQASMIFTRSCRKNIQRINNLADPKIWQFFRPGFFLALAVMITSGILLNHWSQGNYFFMLGVAGVDFALTISLLGSSYVFWTKEKPTREKKL